MMCSIFFCYRVFQSLQTLALRCRYFILAELVVIIRLLVNVIDSLHPSVLDRHLSRYDMFHGTLLPKRAANMLSTQKLKQYESCALVDVLL